VHHIYHLLQDYLLEPRDETWFCASLVTKEGSSYRKPGAMMLVNPWGKTYGMVSGGCLESDVVRRAQKVRANDQAEYVIYDTTDEDSFAAQLGLGCNGKIGILIQAITDRHEALLQMLYQRMLGKKASYLLQCYKSIQKEKMGDWLLLDESGIQIFHTNGANKLSSREVSRLKPDKAQSRPAIMINESYWSPIKIEAPINLWVLGGGPDTWPVVEIATTLGWQVTVVDHRVGYARAAYFPRAKNILNAIPGKAVEHPEFKFADAFICMSHNKEMDAAWMRQLQKAEFPHYIALLGPKSRKKEVMDMAQARPDFRQGVRGPAGLGIGGDMPESIALSIVAECHAALYDRSTTQLERAHYSVLKSKTL